MVVFQKIIFLLLRYGGTHRERFDTDGKGRGKVCMSLSGRHSDNNNAPIQEGRVDCPSDGYVQGYKHKGSYGSGVARTR